MGTVSAVTARRVFRPVVLTVVGMIAALDVILVGGLEVLSATRAYVAAESLWAKGQKDSIAALRRFAQSRDPADYARYERAIAVPLGDHRARLALEQPVLDRRAASEGFLAGGNHPDDIGRMIRLVRWGRREPHIDEALRIWTDADVGILRTVELAQDLRVAVRRTPGDIPAILDELTEVNQQVTPLEVAFSSVLGDAARQIQIALAIAVVLSSIVLLTIGLVLLRRLLAQIDRSTGDLRDSESRKAAILDASLDAIITMDDDSRIVEFSRAAEQMFGRVREEAIGHPLLDVVGSLEMREGEHQGLERITAGGLEQIVGRRVEVAALRADASRFPAELTIAKVSIAGSQLYTGFIRDLTDRKRLEAELVQAQKLEVVGRLAGGVAHDFNNILTALLGFGEVLRERLEEAKFDAPELNEIHHAAERARALTSQLLAFSRKQMLRVVSVDLNALVDRDARLMTRLIGEHIMVKLDLDTSIRAVRGDPVQLGQVLLNLAVNARDAMSQGGTLRISTRAVRLPAADEIGSIPAGDYVRLRIADSGVGIPETVLPHIFEPFFTTKEVGQGSGLGLAMVYGIIKQLGGDIKVSSELGAGTRFDILLPMEPRGEEPEAASTPAPGRVTTGCENILLVEDEASVRDLVQRVLDRHGYRVTAAGSGEEALQMVDSHDVTVDLLLTDAVMPGMSGPTLAITLLNRNPKLKVLVISGFSDHPLLTSGTTRFRVLSKPFRPDDLLRAVREQLDGA
jgi:PAS domain S-box-containing protein